MIAQWICPACGHRFHPRAMRADVQCPKCGTIVEDPSRVDTESSFTDPSEAPTNTRPKKKEPTLEQLDPSLVPLATPPPPEPSPTSEPVRPPTQSKPPVSLPYMPPPTPEPSFWSVFGPTLLVCALFLGWVAYDKLIRHPPAPVANTAVAPEVNELLRKAIENYRKGEFATARDFVNRALQLDPSSPLTLELAQLVRQ